MWYIGQTWEAWPLLDGGLGHIGRLQHAYDLPLPNQPNISKWFSDFLVAIPTADVICFGTPKEWCRYECMCAWIIDICVAGWTRRSNSPAGRRALSCEALQTLVPTTRNTRHISERRLWRLYLCNQLVESFLPYFILQLGMSPFNWCMVSWCALRGYTVTDQNVEGGGCRAARPQCAKQ